MTDAEKLSAPSFQLMTAGLTIGPGLSLPETPGPETTATVIDTRSSLMWDMVVIGGPGAAQAAAPGAVTAATSPTSVPLPSSLLAAQLPGAAAAVNGPNGRGQAPYTAPPTGIAVTPPTYAAVAMDLAAPGTGAPGGSNVVPIWEPSVVAATSALPVGPGGPQGQVVYTSEVPGS